MHHDHTAPCVWYIITKAFHGLCVCAPGWEARVSRPSAGVTLPGSLVLLGTVSGCRQYPAGWPPLRGSLAARMPSAVTWIS